MRWRSPIPLPLPKGGLSEVALLLRACTAGVLCLCFSSGALAQTLRDTLVWERVGTVNDMGGLFFDGDTLYAAAVTGRAQVLRPGDTDFSQAFPVGGFAEDLWISPERAVFDLTAIGASGLKRSTNWGQSWQVVQEDAFTLPVPTPEGALLLGTRGSSSEGGRLAARSTDGGATWTPRGLGDGTDGLGTTHLVVTPPSAALPAGRIVAGGAGGLAYSDDDGRSWLPTALYGGLAYAAWSTVRIAEGPYDGGHPGRILAVVERGSPGGEPTGLYASDDGGATWTRLGPIPGGGTFDTRLAAVPDGAIYAYLQRADEAPVWRTVDGGQTWENLGPVWVEWPAEVSEIVAGPDGRLYAACSGGGFAGYDGGVFRTTERVVTVASEGGPVLESSGSVSLGAPYPNPSDGSVTVPVSVAEGAAVQVHVYDTVGRHVAVLYEGPLAAGEHRFRLDSSVLRAGVYVVRAFGPDVDVAKQVTVAQ